MANFVLFQMYSGPTVTISEDNPDITNELTESTVESITVVGDPWVFFDSYCYGVDFMWYKEGKDQRFPSGLKSIKSVRMIKGGINSSKVTLYAYPFLKGAGESFQRDKSPLEGQYFSLKVDQGAVIFFDNDNFTGGKRILLSGDEVQNFNAVKLISIGKSMKIAK